MSLPDIALLASFTELQKKLAHMQAELARLQKEYDTLLAKNSSDLQSTQARLQADYQTKADLDKLQKDLQSLRSAESDLRRTIITAAEKAFDEYLSSGEYKTFVDTQVELLTQKYGSATVAAADDTQHYVSRVDAHDVPAGQLRVSVMNGDITAVFDPAHIRVRVVEHLLPVAFAS